MSEQFGRVDSERSTRGVLDDHSRRIRQNEQSDVRIEGSRRLFIRSPNGHFWQITVDNAGALTATDVGTASP